LYSETLPAAPAELSARAAVAYRSLPRFTDEVLTTDLSDVSAYFGVRLAGFLGFPLWHNRSLTLDARNGSLRIGPGDHKLALETLPLSSKR